MGEKRYSSGTFICDKFAIDNVSDEEVGTALKAAFEYVQSGNVPKLPPLSMLCFALLVHILVKDISE